MNEENKMLAEFIGLTPIQGSLLNEKQDPNQYCHYSNTDWYVSIKDKMILWRPNENWSQLKILTFALSSNKWVLDLPEPTPQEVQNTYTNAINIVKEINKQLKEKN